MAIKQFAIPLDTRSSRPGETNIKQICDDGTSADFELTNATESPYLDELNLVTAKNAEKKDHKFTVSFKENSATVTVSAADLSKLYDDGEGGDWDYVEANWSVGQVDTPDKSSLYIHQSGNTYNLFGW
jgi:hypothetical protein